MAGNYPDYPSNRFALDLDGTKCVLIDVANAVTEQSAQTMIYLNDELGTHDVGSANLQGPYKIAYIFPELRDLSGMFVNYNSGGTPTVDSFMWSADTTTGVDGTWTAFTFTAAQRDNENPGYRNNVGAISLTGVKAIRFRFMTGYSADFCHIRAWHVFGKIAAGQNPDRLEIWHPILDQRIGAAGFDWGNAQRASSANLTFRVKNRSATLSANNITVSLDALTDTSPSFLSAHLVSADGTNFASTASAGTLAPGVISGVMTLRRTLPANAALGIWAARLKAIAASWT